MEAVEEVMARLREQKQSMDLTTEGQMLGTPDYMAPEQWQRGNADALTDVWLVGVLLFEALVAPVARSAPRARAAKAASTARRAWRSQTWRFVH